MYPDADALQGRLLLGLMYREIDIVSAELEALQTRAADDARRGRAQPGRRGDRARELRSTLRELHRLAENLRRRFPPVPDNLG